MFQNLIANAIHYCKGQPEIKISARGDSETWVLSYKDNGIGIAAEYHECTFGLFERLHNEREFGKRHRCRYRETNRGVERGQHLGRIRDWQRRHLLLQFARC